MSKAAIVQLSIVDLDITKSPAEASFTLSSVGDPVVRMTNTSERIDLRIFSLVLPATI